MALLNDLQSPHILEEDHSLRSNEPLEIPISIKAFLQAAVLALRTTYPFDGLSSEFAPKIRGCDPRLLHTSMEPLHVLRVPHIAQVAGGLLLI